MEQSEIWIKLLRSFNSRLRLIAMAGLGLFIIAFSDWGFQLEDLHKKSQHIAEILFEFSSVEKYINEAKQQAGSSLGKDVRLDELPMLNRAVNKRLKEIIPQKQYQIGSYKLPAVPYRLTIICAPIILFFISIATAVQLRRLHLKLGPFINKNPEIQLLLNSPVFERVTLYYGERRWLHFLIVATIYSPVVFSAAIYIPAVMVTEIEPIKLFVTHIGYIPSPPPTIVIVLSRLEGLAATWAIILGLTITLWLVLSYIVTKPWYVQSSNDGGNEDTSTKPKPSNKMLEQDVNLPR
ncbi:MAG: hypothetical protein KAS57_09935 [Gammaproteobacteria bacterium]|nr:hypothetical protein [Gammaproteobacteria bacterium]